MERNYNLNQTLISFVELEKQFSSLIVNPELKLSKIPNLVVLPNDEDFLIIEALGSTMHIKFQLVRTDELGTLGQATAFLVTSEELTPIRSIWFDKSGNVFKNLSDTTMSLNSVENEELLQGFIYETLDELLKQNKFVPLTNDQ